MCVTRVLLCSSVCVCVCVCVSQQVKECVEMRQELIDCVNALQLPPNFLDQLLDMLGGPEQVGAHSSCACVCVCVGGWVRTQSTCTAQQNTVGLHVTHVRGLWHGGTTQCSRVRVFVFVAYRAYIRLRALSKNANIARKKHRNRACVSMCVCVIAGS